MSKTVLTKEEVSKALLTLRRDHGREPSMRTLHAAVDHRGSMTTLLKLRHQIEEEQKVECATQDPEVLGHFQSVWNAAIAAGRKERDAEVSKLQDELSALVMEAERTEGLLSALECRMVEADEIKNGLIQELATAHRELSSSRATADKHASTAAEALERLSSMQLTHAQAVTTLTDRVRSMENMHHETALALARAEATLAADNRSVRKNS